MGNKNAYLFGEGLFYHGDGIMVEIQMLIEGSGWEPQCKFGATVVSGMVNEGEMAINRDNAESTKSSSLLDIRHGKIADYPMTMPIGVEALMTTFRFHVTYNGNSRAA